MKSGMLCANMWARKEMECFTPEILSLFSLEATCLKHSSPLTSTQVYYITEIRIGFKFPLQFLTCCCGFIVIVVAEVVSYTQIHLNFNSNPWCLFFCFLKKYIILHSYFKLPQTCLWNFFFSILICGPRNESQKEKWLNSGDNKSNNNRTT